jgi:hypothetical protein
MTNSFIDRSVLRIARSPQIAPVALKALLRANELLGLAIGVRLAELRDFDDRIASSICRVRSERPASPALLGERRHPRGEMGPPARAKKASLFSDRTLPHSSHP